MFRLLWKLRSGIGHARGLFALHAGRADPAERFLREAVKSGEKGSSPLLGETYLLLSATVEALGRRAEAVGLFWAGIAEVEQSSTYSTDDVNYLGTYFCQLLEIDDCRRFERFDITAVRRSLRRDFSMSLSKAGLIS
jgi:hypothetical protein